MIAENFEYHAPSSLSDALALLADGSKKVLAGGQSLIPILKLRLAQPEHIVDLRLVPNLDLIQQEGARVRIGAMATHHQIESSVLLRAVCPLLSEGASHIGDVQVRNLGTIGGSVVHADPAADYPAILLALEAQIRLANAHSERVLSADEFFVDTLTTAIEPSELLTELIVPAEVPGTGTSYQKMRHPASGYAVVGVAARVRKAEGRLALVRVGVTGLGPKPFRAAGVAMMLEGTAGTADDIRRAAAVVDEGIDPNHDLFASADYRRHLARVYTVRALTVACERAS